MERHIFPAGPNNYKAFERNNQDIVLNILPRTPNEKGINITYRSDHNRTRQKQVILLMIHNNKNHWHYLAVKSLSRLCRGVTLSNHGDFFCLNCLHSFRTENRLKEHEILCEDHSYCRPILPSEGKDILQYISGEKSLKIPDIIYFDLEAQQIKNDSCSNNTERSCTERKVTHEACGYSPYLARSYGENIQKYYRGKDCMKKFVDDLDTLAMNVINTPKKK